MIELLTVTHNRLRSLETFYYFIDRFKNGKGFQERKKKISIMRTEDGVMYLWDGTHEISAAYYLGVPIDENVIDIKSYTYEQLNSINLSCGYVTPFNPRTHVRLPNFGPYKETVLEILNVNDYNDNNARAKQFILENPRLYRETRKVNTVEELLYASGVIKSN